MESEKLSIEDVIGLCNWMDKYAWTRNEETYLWNNLYNSGGESGLSVEDMIYSYMNHYEH